MLVCTTYLHGRLKRTYLRLHVCSHISSIQWSSIGKGVVQWPQLRCQGCSLHFFKQCKNMTECSGWLETRKSQLATGRDVTSRHSGSNAEYFVVMRFHWLIVVRVCLSRLSRMVVSVFLKSVRQDFFLSTDNFKVFDDTVKFINRWYHF